MLLESRCETSVYATWSLVAKVLLCSSWVSLATFAPSLIFNSQLDLVWYYLEDGSNLHLYCYKKYIYRHGMCCYIGLELRNVVLVTDRPFNLHPATLQP